MTTKLTTVEVARRFNELRNKKNGLKYRMSFLLTM